MTEQIKKKTGKKRSNILNGRAVKSFVIKVPDLKRMKNSSKPMSKAFLFRGKKIVKSLIDMP